MNNSERPWGRYFVIDNNKDYKIKRIEVNQKQTILSISYAKGLRLGL